MKVTIGLKIIGGFAAVIFLVGLMSVFTYIQTGQLDKSYSDMSYYTAEKLALTDEIAIDIANEAVAMRRFNFTGDPNDITIFNQYRQQSNEKIDKVYNMHKTDASHQKLNNIKKQKADYEVIAAKSFEAKKANDMEKVGFYMNEAGAPYKASMAEAIALAEHTQSSIENDIAENNAKAKRIQLTLLIANVIVAIIAILIGIFISRSLEKRAKNLAVTAAAIANGDLMHDDIVIKSEDEIGQLAHSFNMMKNELRALIKQVTLISQQVAASSEELTASAEQSALASDQVAEAITVVVQGAENQSRAVEESTATIQQMSASIQQIAANANTVSHTSADAHSAAENGNKQIETVISQMTNINRTVNNLEITIQTLGKQSNEIGRIVETISGIAAQTNLLALNAAIEAARAGDAGRGFAVVADEVRKLAEQSAQATKDIKELITTIQDDTNKAVAEMATGKQEVEAGTEIITETGKGFQAIRASVNQVSDQINEISIAIQQLAEGSQQIVNVVAHVDKLSKDTAAEAQTVSAATEEQSASAQEIAGASQSLADLAEELQRSINTFKI